MPAQYFSSLWAGAIVYLISLIDTLLLVNERVRALAVSLLIAAALLAVLLWGRQMWIPAFSPNVTTRVRGENRSRVSR